jgi:hypothetical protein
MFLAQPAPVSLPTLTIATSDGRTTYNVDVLSTITILVRATVSPSSPTYAVTINNSPLPSGATATQPSCFGDAVCTKTFTWTPSLSSTSASLCFQSTATNGQSVITTSQLCITVNLNVRCWLSSTPSCAHSFDRLVLTCFIFLDDG